MRTIYKAKVRAFHFMIFCLLYCFSQNAEYVISLRLICLLWKLKRKKSSVCMLGDTVLLINMLLTCSRFGLR